MIMNMYYVYHVWNIVDKQIHGTGKQIDWNNEQIAQNYCDICIW